MVALGRSERTLTGVRASRAPAGRTGPVTRRAPWALIGVAVYAAAALAILLSPVSPERLVAEATAWLRDGVGLSAVRQGWVEFGANVALFTPLGALVTLAFRRPGVGIAAALILSAGAEIVQLALPGRTASARDILANVAGATVGALVVAVVRATRRHEKSMRSRGKQGHRWYGRRRGVQRTLSSHGAPRND
ncbi:VanZ family protein [Microbacterium lushaniae]|nr:VanZ family protein [Microbacterium lushaniae]KAA9155599.1 VanZ family protein [Microbacterium lushaniae]